MYQNVFRVCWLFGWLVGWLVYVKKIVTRISVWMIFRKVYFLLLILRIEYNLIVVRLQNIHGTVRQYNRNERNIKKVLLHRNLFCKVRTTHIDMPTTYKIMVIISGFVVLLLLLLYSFPRNNVYYTQILYCSQYDLLLFLYSRLSIAN